MFFRSQTLPREGQRNSRLDSVNAMGSRPTRKPKKKNYEERCTMRTNNSSESTSTTPTLVAGLRYSGSTHRHGPHQEGKPYLLNLPRPRINSDPLHVRAPELSFAQGGGRGGRPVGCASASHAPSTSQDSELNVLIASSDTRTYRFQNAFEKMPDACTRIPKLLSRRPSSPSRGLLWVTQDDGSLC